MNKLFDAVKEYDNHTVTENGADAYKSTLSACLDLFFSGASCRSNRGEAARLVRNAYKEDKLVCLRTLFYLRDVRGGQGERAVFREGIKEIAKFAPDDLKNVVKLIPEYGRWDDLIDLFGVDNGLDDVIREVIREQVKEDIDTVAAGGTSVSLLWKWLPSENTSSKATVALAKKVRKEILYTDSKSYRKLLSKMRGLLKVIERDLTAKAFGNINYSKIPSKAHQKYRGAFFRNDCERYTKYVNDLALAVKNGNTDVKINVDALYPYEIISKMVVNGVRSVSSAEAKVIDSAWNSQKDYFSGAAKHENWLTVADVSGSMTTQNCRPLSAAVALAIYTSEHNDGIFADKFITFSEQPNFVDFDRNWTIDQKVDTTLNSPWGFNTNLMAVFDLILNAAVKHHISEDEMPTNVIIVSDMQFDVATRSFNSRNYDTSDDNTTALKAIRAKYEAAGYKMPKIIFWNVAGDYKANVPALGLENDVVLFGGCKPGMFEQMISGATPIDFMLSVVNSERYATIELS